MSKSVLWVDLYTVLKQERSDYFTATSSGPVKGSGARLPGIAMVDI